MFLPLPTPNSSSSSPNDKFAPSSWDTWDLDDNDDGWQDLPIDRRIFYYRVNEEAGGSKLRGEGGVGGGGNTTGTTTLGTIESGVQCNIRSPPNQTTPVSGTSRTTGKNFLNTSRDLFQYHYALEESYGADALDDQSSFSFFNLGPLPSPKTSPSAAWHAIHPTLLTNLFLILMPGSVYDSHSHSLLFRLYFDIICLALFCEEHRVSTHRVGPPRGGAALAVTGSPPPRSLTPLPHFNHTWNLTITFLQCPSLSFFQTVKHAINWYTRLRHVKEDEEASKIVLSPTTSTSTCDTHSSPTSSSSSSPTPVRHLSSSASDPTSPAPGDTSSSSKAPSSKQFVQAEASVPN
ncbi:hypothetical protein EV368DRAFT_87362 [Lentinula lateritia]|nr:hypothetical protein EV368DRAFT_87362 [Lentinula lateritia]